MIRLIVRRLLLAIPILFVVLLITFLLLRVGGGDPSSAILGVGGTPQQRAEIRSELNLDKPVWVQFGIYLGSLLTGNLGNSLVDQGQSVVGIIVQRLPVTLSVVIGALLLSIVVGTIVGTWAAIKGGWVDRISQVLSLLGFAIPGFWLALVLIIVFTVQLRWFPTSGYVAFGQDPVAWFSHLVLPVLALSATSIAAIALQTRSAMLDALSQEHIRTLTAAGVSRRSIVFRHALKGASPTIVSVAGLQFIGLLGAVIFVEEVFGLSGIGRLSVDSALNSDFTVLEGLVLFLALFVILANLIVDVAIAALSPKVRMS